MFVEICGGTVRLPVGRIERTCATMCYIYSYSKITVFKDGEVYTGAGSQGRGARILLLYISDRAPILCTRVLYIYSFLPSFPHLRPSVISIHGFSGTSFTLSLSSTFSLFFSDPRRDHEGPRRCINVRLFCRLNAPRHYRPELATGHPPRPPDRHHRLRVPILSPDH